MLVNPNVRGCVAVEFFWQKSLKLDSTKQYFMLSCMSRLSSLSSFKDPAVKLHCFFFLFRAQCSTSNKNSNKNEEPKVSVIEDDDYDKDTDDELNELREAQKTTKNDPKIGRDNNVAKPQWVRIFPNSAIILNLQSLLVLQIIFYCTFFIF